MTISPKARADRGNVLNRVVSSVQKSINSLDYLDSGVCGGIDVDFYLGPWNPDIAKLNGAQFVFVRAGEYSIDQQFIPSWTNSKGVIPRGAYWFLTKDQSTSIDSKARRFGSLFPNGYD